MVIRKALLTTTDVYDVRNKHKILNKHETLASGQCDLRDLKPALNENKRWYWKTPTLLISTESSQLPITRFSFSHIL